MSVLIDDPFDDANGTDVTSRASAVGGTPAENGAATAGQALVNDGAAYSAAGTTNPTIIVWPNDYTDIEAEIVIDLKSQATNHYIGLGLRASAASLLYTSFFGFGDFGGTDFEYGAYSTGDNLYLQTVINGTVATGEHRLKASFRGTLFQGWQDREEVVRVTSDDYASGRVALLWGNQASTTTGVHVKSIGANDDFARSQIQWIGDSHWRGDGPSSNVGRANRVPNVVSNALIAAGVDIDWVNLGVSARQLSEMNTAADQAPVNNTNTIPQAYNTQGTNYGRGANLAYRSGAAKNVVIVIGGTNDLRSGAGGGNVSSATCITRIETLRDTLQNAGHVMIYVHPPHADEGNAVIGAGFNAKVDAVVSWAQANASSFLGGIVDYSGDEDLFNTPSSTYFESDLVHWKAAGMSRLANTYILPVVREQFPGGGYGRLFSSRLHRISLVG